ncbi:MAG: hypothetical protein WD314_04930 [Trueperaceae bacterium]
MGQQRTEKRARDYPLRFTLVGAATCLLIALTACGATLGENALGLSEHPAARVDKLKATTPAPYERLGQTVAIGANFIVAGGFGSAAPGSQGGVVRLFPREGGDWGDSVSISPAEAADASFGHAVASGGSRVVASAPLEGGGGARTGTVFVFEPGDGGWQPTATLTPEEPGSAERFGTSLAIDGGRLAVGAPGAEAQAVYVYSSSETGWELEAKLAAGAGGSPGFGSAVAIDGDRLAVASPSDAEGGRGEVRLFRRSESGWQPEQTLTAPEAGLMFASALALDGDSLLVGAPAVQSAPSVFAYRWDGTDWRQEDRLFSTDPGPGHFGSALALDGNVLAVGAPGSSPEEDGSVGSVHVYERTDESWQHRAGLVVSGLRSTDAFGAAVAVKGGLVLAGATGDSDLAEISGALYLFYLPDLGAGFERSAEGGVEHAVGQGLALGGKNGATHGVAVGASPAER